MEKKKSFLISAAYYAVIAAIVFLVLKYAVFIVMPFIIGFSVAAVLNPIVRFLGHKFGMMRRPTAILILLIFYATIGMLLTIIVVRMIVWVGEFSKGLPSLYRDTVEPLLIEGFELVNNIIAKLDSGIANSLSSGIGDIFASIRSSLANAVSSLSVWVLSKLSGIAASIPGLVVELLFGVISSFFFIVDYEKLMKTARSRLPAKAVGIMVDLRDRFFITILKYLRSYALILLITYAELFLGLTVIGVENSAMLALIIALLDILPVVGTGAVMLPWAILELVSGSAGRGVGLILVWAAITVIRNVIEPKIVGSQVGLHPLLTLAAMFVGTKLFGFFGLIFLPVTLSILLAELRGRAQSASE